MNNWLTYTLEERKVMMQNASANEKLPDYARKRFKKLVSFR